MKKLLVLLFVLIGSLGQAFAQADVNKADQAALDGIRGIGPAMSKRILDERKKGEFKDWGDLEARVKGVGAKSAERLSNAGLRVNGQPRGKSSATTNVGGPGATKKAKEQDAKSDQTGAVKG